MKRNLIVAAGIALVLALVPGRSRAQDNPPAQQPPPAAPTAPANPGSLGQPVAPAPGPRPRPMPPRFNRSRMYVQRAVADLRMTKMALQNAQEDYNGHKDTAIAACDKAMQELEEVLKAMPKPPPPQRPGSTFQNNLNRIGPPPGSNPPPGAPQPAPPPTAPPPQ